MESASKFVIGPWQRFAGRNSAMRRPQEITHFSYDERHALRLDESSLRTYYPPDVGEDLSAGFDTFVKHDDSVDEHLDGLLAALTELEKRTSKLTTDIVTWRGMITKDTIFIEENHAYKMATRGKSTPQQDVMSFMGYKFETLATLPRSWDECPRELIENRHAEVVNNEAQFCSIVKTGFGNVRLVLGGEVDAVWDRRPDTPTPDEPINYVELKTSKEITSNRDDLNFERKLLRIWAQSFLLGVGRIVVGFRDPAGILLRLHEFDTQAIPNVAKRGHASWDGKVAVNFTAQFLEWLKDVVVDEGEGDGVVWRIRHAEGADAVEVFRTADKGFLPASFVEWRRSGQVQ